MDGEIVIGVGLDSKSFEIQIEEIEKELRTLEKRYEETANMPAFKGQEEDMQNLALQIEKVNNKLITLKKRQSEVNSQGWNEMKKNIDEANEKLTSMIRKVGKMGLAVIGVRSAYMGIRRAISLVTSQNQEVANQFDVLRATVANALLPVVQKIVEWLALAMIYINNIVKGITGKYIFDFEKAFASVKENAKKTSGYAKEIRKTLFGFDEMNILNENVTGGVGAGGLTNTKLTNPFENWQDVEMPEWVDDVINFGKWVIDNWSAAVAILLSTKSVFELFSGNLVGAAASSLASIGFSLYEIYNSIQDYINTAPEYQDAIEAQRSADTNLADAKDRLAQAIQTVTNLELKRVNAIDRVETSQKKLTKAEKDARMSIEQLLDKMEKENLSYGKLEPKQKNLYKAYLENKDAQEQLDKITANLTKAKEDEAKAAEMVEFRTVKEELANIRATKSYEEYQDAVVKAFEDGKINAIAARDAIERGMSDIDTATAKTFKEKLPDAIKSGLDINRYRGVIGTFKRAWETILDGLGFSTTIKVKTNKSSSGNNYTAGSSRTFYTGAVVKLAPGGIVNLPGRGVPVGSNGIMGERGAEGVIPLSNQQMMEQLGQTIAKYISFNATIPINIGNRLVAKEIKQINAENDFAFNR
jgi:hypothetical protein